jgi:hypothetical protein
MKGDAKSHQARLVLRVLYWVPGPDFGNFGELKLSRAYQSADTHRDYKMCEPFAIFHFKYRSLCNSHPRTVF